MAKLLFLAGSARSGSYNAHLAKAAYDIAKAKGADAELIDMKDYDMPIYDGDCEEERGLPDTAKALKQKFISADGILIAAPEYNSSITPLLKNALDWISRPETDDEPMLAAFKGKVAALVSASPGGFGGMRGLVPLRMMLENIAMIVIPQTLSVPAAHKIISDEGTLDDEWKDRLTPVIEALISTTDKLSS